MKLAVKYIKARLLLEWLSLKAG